MNLLLKIKTLFLIIGALGLTLVSFGAAHAKTSEDIQWQRLETKYTIIRYQSMEDLKKFGRKIDYSPEGWSLKRLFSRSGSDSLAEDLKMKVDAIYERVQEILDMRNKAQKVFINIYSHKNQLLAVRRRMFQNSFSAYGILSPPRAWYIYELNTIYINVNDLREGMLAHEMAHSIIDHYLSVRPPKATAEILARYVDSHLYK
jgi:hypothetical protein